ncbi:MAG: hypothetical protein NVS4B8_20250 [Herpetosiphon sp.]
MAPALSAAHPAMHAAAVEVVLDYVLRDWHENENTVGLLPDDTADLRSFVQLAAAAANGGRTELDVPVFRAVLTGLLADWLQNWNTAGDPGPPGPG